VKSLSNICIIQPSLVFVWSVSSLRTVIGAFHESRNFIFRVKTAVTASYRVQRWIKFYVLTTNIFNLLTPNDDGRTAPLTSKHCILYIYSTNIGTEYFKRGIYCPFFSSSKCSLFHNSNVFGSWIIHILYTGCVKLKKIIPSPKGQSKLARGIFPPSKSRSRKWSFPSAGFTTVILCEIVTFLICFTCPYWVILWLEENSNAN